MYSEQMMWSMLSWPVGSRRMLLRMPQWVAGGCNGKYDIVPEIWTPSVDVYSFEEQFCQISSWFNLKRISPGLFGGVLPQQEEEK